MKVSWVREPAWHTRYVEWICANPVWLLAVAVGYVICVVIVVVLCFFSAFSLRDWLYPGTREALGLELSFAGIAFVFAILVAAHYLYLSYRCFTAPPQSSSFRYPAFRVVQLVLTTVILFAVIHYYIALFSVDPAYHGLAPPMPAGGWKYYQNWMDRLIFWPSRETALDCFYFSTVTMATLGYGDIYPVSLSAKLATIAEIFSSFTLIVVVLGSVIGGRGSK